MKIHPKSRYSQHAQKATVPGSLIMESIVQFDPSLRGAEVRLLSGGFMNSNFLVSKEQSQFVFRVYSSDQWTAQREQSVLSFLQNTNVRAPNSYGLFEIQGKTVAVIEYFNGVTLEDKLLSPEGVDTGIYHDIGVELSRIHQIRFDEAGFIGPQMKIGREYENFSSFLQSFIDRTLKMLESRRDRLGIEMNQRLRNLVAERWDLLLATEPRRELVHCDFNPKNILVTKGSETKILGVIDWEFCLSGNGLIDIGNFFRFSDDFPSEAKEKFQEGYTEIQDLPENWFEICKLADIANMFSFLERPENYQETFRTARSVLSSTLEQFGY